MRLFKREAQAAPVVEVLVPEEPLDPVGPPLELIQGSQYCSSRGCSEETGLACDYIDRRERHCPTAWCPEHRSVTHGHVYCPTHAQLVDGTTTDFGEHAHVDLENRVPNLISWAAKEMETDITGMMSRLCEEYHEQLVVDPVRFVLVGVERVRTWERAWKMVAHIGVSLRVTVAVEENDPLHIHGRVNSKPVISIPTPWHPDHGLGVEPATAGEAEAAIRGLRERMFMALARRVEQWHQDEPPPPEPQITDLEGWPGGEGSWSAPSPSPPYQGTYTSQAG